jgi:hypothetical protein
MIAKHRPDLLPQGLDDGRYARTLTGDIARSAICFAPPHWREAAAERWLRRAGAPGPANEHVFQYLLSKKMCGNRAQGQAEQTIAKGADLFYERQYRQYLNATMGAYAATATVAFLGSGGKCRGHLWGKHRPVCAATVEAEAQGAPPIAVLGNQSVAVPLMLPAPAGLEALKDIDQWLSGQGPMPRSYRERAAGEPVRCATPGARARRRGATGALIELADAVRRTGKLAILALHPHDPDAMGLHITLFGTQIVSPNALEADYGLEEGFLRPWREAAQARNSVLRFCVGGTEELFAHCSLNLFVKRRLSGAELAPWPHSWCPSEPLDALLAKQCELFQVTVSASGLPGVSPRNGDVGKAGFLVRHGGKASILMPYFTGNFAHGHAAKLWSNPRGALIIRDDHWSLRPIVIQGRSRTADHEWVKKHFPHVASEFATRRKRSGELAGDPEYWFVQEVAEILLQNEPLAANALDPVRPTGSIHAAGPALYDKKATYFATSNLPCYDQASQHEREAAGRPVDPSGAAHRDWARETAPALAARLAHLERTGAANPAIFQHEEPVSQ